MFIELTKQNGEAFTNLRFCSIALTKDKNQKQEYKNHLRIKDGICSGTDGKRLHTARIGFDDGMYKVLKCTKNILQITSVDIDADCYPDLSSIVDLPYTDSNLWTKHKDMDIEAAYTLVAIIIRSLPENEGVDYHMIEDILKDDYFTTYTCNEGGDPIVLVSGDKKAFIMSVKCNN